MSPVETRALELLAEGRRAEAADAYLELSRSAEGAVAHDLMLKAVALFLDVGHADRASALLDELAAQTLTRDPAARRDLLAADLAIQQGRPERTIDLLSGTAASRFGPASAEKAPSASCARLRGHGTPPSRQRANGSRSTRCLSARSNEPRTGRRCGNLLERADRGQRERALASASSAFLGWIRLSLLVEDHRAAPFAFERALTQWRADFPGHPANAPLVDVMLESTRKAVPQPSRVALLLPLQGDFAEAAIAVRDGFLAAWNGDAPNRKRPAVEIYDTSFDAIEVCLCASGRRRRGPGRRAPAAGRGFHHRMRWCPSSSRRWR